MLNLPGLILAFILLTTCDIVLQTLLLKVPICCEGCEKRVVKKLLKVPGVVSVRCDIDRQSVTVRGTADTDEVLREAKKAFKKSRLW